MLSFIKANYSAGDPLDIVCSQGTVTGEIEYVSNNYIVLRQPNGQIIGISASDIRTFTAASPVPLCPDSKPVTKAPAPEPADTDIPTETIQEEEETTEAADHATATPAPVYKLSDNSDVPTLAEPKVVGQIDLDSLNRIDPKYSRRRYFRGNEEKADGNHASAAPGQRSPYGTAPQAGRGVPYVPAKGRITFYNSEKHYGFIHDYATENSFYFLAQQVCDSELYDQLHKGTKVNYTADRNAQGFVARSIHLAHTVRDLLDLADEHLDAHRLQHAEAIAEHILDVFPDNADAKDLLDQIHEATPQPRFAPRETNAAAQPYNAYVTYAQAKRAYLSKDYAEAEQLYLKAIQSGEKVESSVKDLLTLYVSLYKQSESESDKSAAHAKAEEFLANHRALLADNLTNKQFLALNYYLPMQDYAHFIQMVDDIMTDPSVADVVSRRVFFMWQKGIALNKSGRAEEALDLAEEGLKLAPRSRQLQNLRDYILFPESRNTDAAAAVPANGAAPAPAAASKPVAESASPAQPAAPAAKAVKKSNPEDNTGTPQSDDWWEELKKPGLI